MDGSTARLDIEVVVVCDPVEGQDDNINHLSRNGDRPDQSSLELIRGGLAEVTDKVVHYSRIDDFVDNITAHRNSVIFPYWFGEVSRNRHALVPAICEAYGVPYVGADTYTKSVCNDKHLSKLICYECGLATPRGLLVTGPDDLSCPADLPFPAVVKPLFQGSSLGISEDSLVRDLSAARRVASEIVEVFGWPVLIEEMLTGREISICVLGDHQSAPEIRALSWELNGDPAFLDQRLFTYALKYLDDVQFAPILAPEVLTPGLRSACEKLFRMLDKVEVLRIDGRLTEKGFSVIELSPDLDLRPDGELAVVFGEDGYPSLLRRLLINALKRHRS